MVHAKPAPDLFLYAADAMHIAPTRCLVIEDSSNGVRGARAAGMATVGLTGEGGGRMAAVSDHLLAVPSRSTPLIQQVQICLYHYLCAGIETRLAG